MTCFRAGTVSATDRLPSDSLAAAAALFCDLRRKPACWRVGEIARTVSGLGSAALQEVALAAPTSGCRKLAGMPPHCSTTAVRRHSGGGRIAGRRTILVGRPTGGEGAPCGRPVTWAAAGSLGRPVTWAAAGPLGRPVTGRRAGQRPRRTAERPSSLCRWRAR